MKKIKPLELLASPFSMIKREMEMLWFRNYVGLCRKIDVFPSGYYDLLEDTLKNGPFLKDEPDTDVKRLIKEEFLKLKEIISENDILKIYEFPTGFKGFDYYSARFGDEHVKRENWDYAVNNFIPRTHIFAEFWPNGEFSIKRIGINPKYQQEGIGKMLYSTAESIAKEFGCPKIELDTPISNKGFWKKMGFDASGVKYL